MGAMATVRWRPLNFIPHNAFDRSKTQAQTTSIQIAPTISKCFPVMVLLATTTPIKTRLASWITAAIRRFGGQMGISRAFYARKLP